MNGLESFIITSRMIKPSVDISEVFIEETDASRIIKWSDVTDMSSLTAYYKQRLGPSFRKVPVVQIEQAAFRELIHGDYDLYIQMIHQEIDAASELFVTHSPERNKCVIMGLGIENRQPGSKAIRFISENKKTANHQKWLESLVAISKDCRDLYWKWKRGPVKFHKINVPMARPAVAATAEF